MFVRISAALVALAIAAALPACVLAHPLGNFTINHYAEVRVELDRVLLDVVIDHAEVPAFEARSDLDLDGDASISDDEIDAGRVAGCRDLAGSLSLTADGEALQPRLLEAGLWFPRGVGGLSTMRQVCTFEAPLTVPIPPAGVELAYVDRSYAERAGWREIVARGSGVTLQAVEGELRDTSLSERLSRYPEDSITTVVSDTMLAVLARPGGPSLPALDVMDASPVDGEAPSPSTISPGGGVASPAAIPGGISAAELPDIFRQADLTPMVMILSLAAAAALGAGHALTPGHGKTLMAAYLVGTRGSTRHAIGLGAAVSVSHTAGILALAAIIVTATDVVAPDVVVRWSPVVAAISILLIGVWMLLGEVRRRRAEPAGLAQGRSHDHDHHGPHPHDHPHDHGHDHPHGPIPTTITWRSLFLLGLAGGLIPSTSALLILLGSIATGRPAFGLVLVVAFGLGMAAVMSGLGLVVVTARDRFDRVGGGVGLTRVRSAMPLIASVVVVGLGIVLTAQALSAVRVL
ncbi:MAG TPA: hypothetical protein VIB02_10790 [Candidatus Limnocylindrales bacterium]